MRRREWLRAMHSELGETHGVTRLRWLLGMAWVSALGLVTPIVVAGVVFGVVGGTIGNHEIFLEVYRGGSNSWIGALALTMPTALVGLAAALLVLRRHGSALAAAYAFAALVVAQLRDLDHERHARPAIPRRLAASHRRPASGSTTRTNCASTVRSAPSPQPPHSSSSPDAYGPGRTTTTARPLRAPGGTAVAGAACS